MIDVNNLWLEYQRSHDDEIRTKLIEQYLPLVKVVAGRIAIGLPQHVDKEDFISTGFFGLLNAIERFDPLRGVKFETYAIARIRGAILDAIRAQDWVPTTIRQKAKLYEKTLGELENELGRSATDEEVAQRLNLNPEQFYNLVNQLNTTTLIPLEDFINTETPSHALPSPTQHIEEQEVKGILAKAIDKLPEKEKTVVAFYYYEGLTLKEISVILKLSEARISQLHTKAIFRLRGALSRYKYSLL